MRRLSVSRKNTECVICDEKFTATKVFYVNAINKKEAVREIGDKIKEWKEYIEISYVCQSCNRIYSDFKVGVPV